MADALLDILRERVAPLGDAVELVERDYEACGFHREVACPPEAVPEIARVFRQADYFLEMMAATDCEGTATVSYTFNRFGRPDRMLVRVEVEADQVVPSISAIFPGANWNEREAHELVGVEFSGHPGLKRLLLPEDATFFPLRKDFGVPDEVKQERDKFKKKKARLLARKKAAARKKADAKAKAKPVAKATQTAEGESKDEPKPEE